MADDIVKINQNTKVNIPLSVTSGSVVIYQYPQNGKVSYVKPTLNYTPNPNYLGQDTFGYKISTSFACGGISSVTVIINALPVTRDMDLSVENNESLIFDLGYFTSTPYVSDPNDPISTLVFSIINPPAHGTITFQSIAGSIGFEPFSYQPNPSYTGSDYIKYRVCDQDIATAIFT